LVGIAVRVNPITAVIVKLSLGQGQIQAGVPVSMAASVGAISAVIVMLSPEHGQSFPWQVGLAEGVISFGPGGGVGVSSVGVARSSNVAVGAGVMVTRNGLESQDVMKSKIRVAGKSQKR
jgi:hypothetical protein